MTRNVKIMSVSMNLGQVNRSTEIAMNGIVKDTRIDLTPKIKRLLVKIIKESNTNIKFNIKKAKNKKKLKYCNDKYRNCVEKIGYNIIILSIIIIQIEIPFN